MAQTKINLGAQGLTGSIEQFLFASQSVGATAIQNGSVVDVHIGATAAIAYSKLNLSGSIKDSDIGATAAIADSKLAEDYILANGSRGFTADQDMGGHKLTGLAQGTTGTDAVTKAQLDAVAASVSTFEWQPSVHGITGVEPAGVTFDRYLIIGGTGAWAAHENNLAEFNGSAWVYTPPVVGMFVADDSQPNQVYLYGGGSWAPKYFEQTHAGLGLEMHGFTMDMAPSVAGNGLTYASGVLGVVGATGILVGADYIAVDGGTAVGKFVQLGGTGTIGDLPVVDGHNVTNVDANMVDGLHAASFLRADASSGVSGATLSVYNNSFLDMAGTENITGTLKFAGVTLTADVADLNALGTIVTREIPTPAPDGLATDFFVANIPLNGSESLFINGILQDPGALADYVADYANKKFTFPDAPKSTDKPRISYRW